MISEEVDFLLCFSAPWFKGELRDVHIQAVMQD